MSRRPAGGRYLYRCDWCGATTLQDDKDPPPGWHSVHVQGWVGTFQACCEVHARLIETDGPVGYDDGGGTL